MRESGAVGGTNGIDPALVIGQVQKFTRRGSIHPITISPPLPDQVFISKRIHGHPQVSGDSFHIRIRVGGGHGLATICTGKAINGFPNTRLQRADAGIQSARLIFRDPGQKSPKGAAMLFEQGAVGTDLLRGGL